MQYPEPYTLNLKTPEVPEAGQGRDLLLRQGQSPTAPIDPKPEALNPKPLKPYSILVGTHHIDPLTEPSNEPSTRRALKRSLKGASFPNSKTLKATEPKTLTTKTLVGSLKATLNPKPLKQP